MAYWHKSSTGAFDIPNYAQIPSLVEQDLEITDSLDGSTVGDVEGENLSPQHLPTRFLIALTCGIGGLQLVWSTLFSHGSTYLSTLGVTKSQSSLIWAAGPICGAIIQPIVGAISDRSQSALGRRRPFILGGALAVVVSLTALAWIEALISSICHLFQFNDHLHVAKAASPYGAILGIVILNLAIQPLQFGIRSLIVDTCSSEQQSVASAWAGRFTGIGNIVAYVIGSLPIPFISGDYAGDYETWRFRYMAFLSVVALATTTLITIHYIHEESSPRESYEESSDHPTPLSTIIGDVVRGWKTMPQRTRSVCNVQFFAWMGWFGFHFYSTSYISGLYLNGFRQCHIAITSTIMDNGMRIATLASLMSAIAALATTIILPRITSQRKGQEYLVEKHAVEEQKWWTQIHVIWGSSHILYTLCTFSTLFIASSTVGTLVVALVGLAMGVTQWAPFALIGEEIASRHEDLEFPGKGCGDHSGAIMGIHSASTEAPQILAALICSCVFWIAQRVGSGNGTSWVLGLSGIAAAVAASFA